MTDAKAFEVQFPQSPHVWDAKELVAKVGLMWIRCRFPSAPTPEEVRQEYQEIAEAQDAPKVMRAHANGFLIELALEVASSATVDSDAKWNDADAKIVSFQKEFGSDFSSGRSFPDIVLLRDRELGALYNTHQTVRFEALVQKLTSPSETKVMRSSVTAHLIIVSEDEIGAKMGTATDAEWDMIEAKIEDFQKQFGDGPLSLKEILSLRQEQLMALRKSGNTARFQALLEKLLVDPHPEVVSMTKDFRNDAIRKAEERANSAGE